MKRLDDLAQKGAELLEGHEPVETHRDYEYWIKNVARWLKEISPGSGLSAEWISLGTSDLVTPDGYNDGPVTWHNFKSTVQRRLLWLSKVPQKTKASKSLSVKQVKRNTVPKDNNKVFIVHGHDDKIKETAARFVEKLGLQAIILHEQPNSGRTIIEKFIEYSNVCYAVVILTGDDLAKSKKENNNDLKPRARQNVIFELGYFIGKLDRNRVCALYKAGIEIPSDYQGVLFTQLDEEGLWKFKLAKEMKAVGIPLDMNKIT